MNLNTLRDKHVWSAFLQPKQQQNVTANAEMNKYI